MENKHLRSVLTIGEWIIFLFILGLCLVLVTPLFSLRSGISSFVVQTGSMEPTIKTGSLIFTKKINIYDIKKNTIVAFVSPKTKKDVIVHRIIDKKTVTSDGKDVLVYLTKGDNNNSLDGWEVYPVFIHGAYVTGIPYIGYVTSFTKTPIGFICLIVIPSLFLILLYVIDLIKAIREVANKKSPKILIIILLFLFTLLASLTPIIKALWLKTVQAGTISISVKDFVSPPAPTLSTPSDNSYLNTSGLVMNWTDVSDFLDMHNPVYYIYQSALNSSFSPAAYTSGHLSASQIPAPGTPNGVYWWHVKACDTLDNCSDWSAPWKVTVDSTLPPAPTNLHWRKTDGNTISCGGATNNYTITADWNDVTDPAPGQLDKYEYYVTYPKLDGTTGTWSTFVTPSQYTGVFNAGQGIHIYKVRTYDKAGNISNWSDNCSINYDTVNPSSVSLSIEGSFTKAVEEKVTNGGLESGLTGWTTAGDVAVTTGDTITQPSPEADLVINPYDGSASMARIGNYTYPSDEGNKVWENRLMQSVSGGAKSLSLHYNYASYDYAFDDPGFFIRLNGREIFKADPSILSVADLGVARSTGWQQFSYDLSDYSNTDKLNLAIYAGNTLDNTLQSWAYVDAITTYFVSAPGHAIYTLVGSDGLSGINHYEYRIGGGSWQQTPSTFQVTEHGDHWIEYYAVDNAGNNSSIYRVQVITDNENPSTIDDLAVDEIATNSATLSWTSPGNDGISGRAAKYDIRYSTLPIDLSNFETATSVGKIPAPQNTGMLETVEILGLNPSTTYYFAIRAADEAPNWSGIDTTTGTTSALAPLTTVTLGDIIINELMWMGTSASPADEWIELRNMTDRTIDLTGFKIQKYNGTTYADMVTLPVASIAPQGYFLIANYAPGSVESQLKSSVTADLVTTFVDLSAGHLQLQLTDPLDNVLDTAWDYTFNLSAGEGEGLYDAAGLKYYSMERTSIPGDGINSLSWYTCIDSASRTEFFSIGTVGSDVRGTPRIENRSENEPLAHQTTSVRPTPTISATPEATLSMSDDKKTVSFSVKDIAVYDKLSYEISYDTFSSAKGMVGADIDITSLDTYEKTGLDLATCSGEVCMYDTDIKNIKLIITLKDSEEKETVLEKNL